jgi:hypothetical protein
VKKDEDKETGFAVLLLGAAVGIVYSPAVNGWVLSRLWLWYAVPLGYREVSWKVFTAVWICAALFSIKNVRENDKVDHTGSLLLHLIAPWLLLLMGWLPL